MACYWTGFLGNRLWCRRQTRNLHQCFPLLRFHLWNQTNSTTELQTAATLGAAKSEMGSQLILSDLFPIGKEIKKL